MSAVWDVNNKHTGQHKGQNGAAFFLDGNLTPRGYEQITNLSSVAALTVPNNARVAFIQAETQDVRWRDDQVDPSSSVGIILSKDSDGFWYNGSLDDIRFIEIAASAKLNISYY